MVADKAKWLKMLPLFGSLSPNLNENRPRGKPGLRRGRTRTPAQWGPGLGDAERGTWWGLESGWLWHRGRLRFKSFGAKPGNQGKTAGSCAQGGRACGAAVVPVQIWESSLVCCCWFWFVFFNYRLSEEEKP